jgi:hypothetical protein
MGPLRVIRGMNRVLGKRNRVVNLRWRGGDRGIDVQCVEAPDQLLIKVGDRPCVQRDPLDAPVVDSNHDLMVDQVDVDREAGPATPDG